MRPTRETLLLAILIAVQLVPIWAFPFFPTQDGPVHLTIARILRDYERPDAQVLRDYFSLNREAVPNWFVYFLLADVLRFVSLPVAEKLLLSAYVVLLPLSLRFALGGADPDNRFLAVLALPFTFNFLLNMGFYNFSLSLMVFLLALGWWLRHRERFGPLQAAGLAGLAVWLYFCHAVSLVALLAAIGAAAAWLAIQDMLRGESILRAAQRRLLWPLLASIPAVALTASYTGSLGEHRFWLPFLDRLEGLAILTTLVSLDARIRFLSFFLAVCLAGLALWLLVGRLRRGDLGPADAPLAAVAALVVLALVSPEEIGIGGFITYRLNLFPYLVLVLWLATFPHSARRRLGLQLLGAGVALAMLGFLVPRWQVLNGYLAEHLSAAPWIEPGSTLLPLPFSPGGETPDGGPVVERILPFLHSGDHVTARKTVANLNLFAAGTDAFPVRYRPERDPYTYLRSPTGVNLQFPGETGARIDYVLAWWPEARWPRLPRPRALLRQLDLEYDRIYTSPRGLVRLYRRKGFTASP